MSQSSLSKAVKRSRRQGVKAFKSSRSSQSLSTAVEVRRSQSLSVKIASFILTDFSCRWSQSQSVKLVASATQRSSFQPLFFSLLPRLKSHLTKRRGHLHFSAITEFPSHPQSFLLPFPASAARCLSTAIFFCSSPHCFGAIMRLNYGERMTEEAPRLNNNDDGTAQMKKTLTLLFFATKPAGDFVTQRGTRRSGVKIWLVGAKIDIHAVDLN